MRLSIVVHANSKNPRIVQDMLGVNHVYVREPAQEGKANNAVIEALSTYYKKPKSSIQLIKGASSKFKIIEIL
jgi:uncharacterized protein YggU (UPF0235/DUF167 family)